MGDATRPTNLLDLSPEGLAAFFVQMGEKGFRGTQVMKWIYQQGVTDFDAMTNLAKPLRQRLAQQAEIRLPEVVLDQAAGDGTRKWLLRLADGNCIETVYIPESNRATLCVSSQVGCILNCDFCSTARQGFNRNLSCGEIIAQVWLAAKLLGQFEPGAERKISNIVMMGMGEPLLNLDNVIAAMDLMMDDNAFGLSKRRVTLSTAGVVPALDELRQRSSVSLAVSLHATHDELRDKLVPLNRKYPLRELLAACRRYTQDKPRAKITFEYVMLDGVNDSPRHARELIRLLQGIPAKINLIPFNPFPGSGYRCSPAATVLEFQNILIKAGHTALIRRTRGGDIDAACGQLAGKVRDRTQRSTRLQRSAAGLG